MFQLSPDTLGIVIEMTREKYPNFSRQPWRCFKGHCVQNKILLYHKNVTLLNKNKFQLPYVNTYCFIGK